MIRSVSIMLAPFLFAMPAQACWNDPSQECFVRQWTDEALAHHASGPDVERLYDLIDWDVLPPGAQPARALLQGLRYEDLVAHTSRMTSESGEDRSASNPLLDMMFPDALNTPSPELALMLMLGYFNAPEGDDLDKVPSDYLMSIRNLAVQSTDAALVDEWTEVLPDYLRGSPELADPDAEDAVMSLYFQGQERTLAVLRALRNGDRQAARDAAAGTTGEPGFFSWIAIARDAIAAEDLDLLQEAVGGMQHAVDTQLDGPGMSDEEFARALAAAEAEFAMTGDPDAIVHLYEGLDGSVGYIPVEATLSIALAQEYLDRRAGQSSPSGLREALDLAEKTFPDGSNQDHATLMRNARTALKLGLDQAADDILDMAFTHSPGVPGFQLYDLPAVATPWANSWLDRMIARYDDIMREPDRFSGRESWAFWVGEEVLTESINITRNLANYGRIAEAEDFAARAESYIAGLEETYPDIALPEADVIFRNEVIAVLLAPEAAAARLRAMGEEELGVAYAFARAGRYDLALIHVDAADGPRNLPLWMNRYAQVASAQRHDFAEHLIGLVDDEIMRLQDHPILIHELLYETTLLQARIGDWAGAGRSFERIKDLQSQHGELPAIRFRLLALRDLARLLSEEVGGPVEYPYDDFAL